MTDFARAGYEVVGGVFSAEACDDAARHVEEQVALAARAPHAAEGFWPRFRRSATRSVVLFDDGGTPSPEMAVRYGHALHDDDPVFSALARAPALTDALARALGPGARIVQAAVVRKPPGLLAAQFGWHQDAWYLPADPDELVLAFVPLDDTSPDNGCLEVLPGSHRGGRTHTLELGQGGFVPSRGERSPGPIDDRGKVVLALPRGSLALVHGLTFHASGPNRTRAPRRALLLHALSARAELDPRAWLRAARATA